MKRGKRARIKRNSGIYQKHREKSGKPRGKTRSYEIVGRVAGKKRGIWREPDFAQEAMKYVTGMMDVSA